MSGSVNYKEIILKTLLGVGLVAVVLVAPNALQILKPIISKKKKQNFTYTINKKIIILQKQGYIKLLFKDGNKFIALTKKGQVEIEKYLLNDLEIKKPAVWDKKWRIVSFDIKNTRTPLRNLLRFHLQRLGFVQYQKSIWIHPYECEEIIIMLKSYFKFGREVMYIVAEYLENDRELKKHFDLKQ